MWGGRIFRLAAFLAAFLASLDLSVQDDFPASLQAYLSVQDDFLASFQADLSVKTTSWRPFLSFFEVPLYLDVRGGVGWTVSRSSVKKTILTIF